MQKQHSVQHTVYTRVTVMPGSLTVSTDPVRKQSQRGADKTRLHARTHALTTIYDSVSKFDSASSRSHVAQTRTHAADGTRDERTAVQTSKKRIPKQLTHSGGRSSEKQNETTKRKRFLNVGCRALALVSHYKENLSD